MLSSTWLWTTVRKDFTTHEIAKKWTMPLRNWGKVLGELEIMYPERLG